jgi:hypothetical protein
MTQRSKLVRPGDGAGADYWLGHCEGFGVFADGRFLGTIEYVRYETDHRHPDTLGMRGGGLGHREVLVPVTAVETLDPDAESLVVTAEFARALPPSWAQVLRARLGATRAGSFGIFG